MNRCTAYRRRGPSYPLPCAPMLPGDLSPSTGCEDPRRFDQWARGIVGPTCLTAAPAGCL